MLRIAASEYKWYQRDRRGHHLVIFSTPSEAINIDQSFNNIEFKCSLFAWCPWPTWTPTHGSIKKWEPISVDDSHTGLLIPRFWWNVYFWFLPKSWKKRLFSMEIEPKNPST